jgi:hypothetical protein
LPRHACNRTGKPVIVNGVVTVASGALDEGFAVQDASGGIYVSRTAGAAVKAGDQVHVSGSIVAPNKQIAIEPAGIGITEPVASRAQRNQDRRGWTCDRRRLIAVQGKITAT